MSPTFDLERQLNADYIVGIDEAGCGPWAGPVVVSSVLFEKSKWEFIQNKLALNDSKKLTAAKRDKLFDEIKQHAAHYAVAEASVEEIDQLNIVKAVTLATKRCLDQLQCPIEALLIDGIRNPKLPYPTHMIVKGDSKSCSIAAASILAKVTRDRIMADLAKKYPQYGFESNAGYGTKKHIEAINLFGITDHHRKSYAPIKRWIQESLLKKTA